MVFLYSLMISLREIFLAVASIQNNSFPRPLSAAQERDCLRRMEEGDLEARRLLIEHNLRLVAHVIKKFEPFGEDKEDLISIGTIGLIKAINTFNRGKGTRLATYAAKCISNELLMHFRASRKQNCVSLHESIGIDKEGNEITLMEVIAGDDSTLEQVEATLLQERLLEMVAGLKRREKKVLSMRYGLEQAPRQTQKQVAGHLGISRSYVSRIEKRALQKLGREFTL